MKPMPSVSRVGKRPPPFIPPFENGERMDQKTFHELYLQTPPGFRAELIGGIVHVASPVSGFHSIPNSITGTWLGVYAAETPGTQSCTDSSAIMSEESEPQPDQCLRVTEQAGGQSHWDERRYLIGAPELAVEISNSTAGIDLNAKLRDYEEYGVREYLVVVMRQRVVHWFIRRKDRFTPMKPDADGVLKSKVFAGLWLDTAGVFDETAARLLATLRKGLTSPEHTKFVAKLAKKLAK
jgi:Uma2 family endonuclease